MLHQDAGNEALPTGPGSRIIRAADAEAWERGVNFYLQVQQRAERVEADAIATYDAERARGYADGKAEGEREAARLVIETVAAVDRYLARLEQDVAGLAMSVIRRAIGELDVRDLVARAAAQAVPDFRRSKWLIRAQSSWCHERSRRSSPIPDFAAPWRLTASLGRTPASSPAKSRLSTPGLRPSLRLSRMRSEI
jgi:hypothetical protein